MNYEKEVKELARQYLIGIDWKYKTANSGRAIYDDRLIILPKKIDTVGKFYTALHEIGHIMEGRQKTTYQSEYIAMQWALNKVKEYKIDSKIFEEKEKRYLTNKLCKAKNRGAKFENIPKEVFKFSRLDKGLFKKSDKIYICGKTWVKDCTVYYCKTYKTHEGIIAKPFKEIHLPNLITT